MATPNTAAPITKPGTQQQAFADLLHQAVTVKAGTAEGVSS